ncbi:hypothetical protein HZA55_00500, partial [Candidatus Poribacteria bacterium]|nr:hypothetical protein [Candidatus Poribacteria bacterium]
MLNSIEDEIDLKEYFLILKKKKKIILIACLTFFAVTLIINLLSPKTYSASGKIFINRKKMELKMEPKFQTYSNEEVDYETYADLLKNNELLSDVIKQLNLNMAAQDLGKMITIENSSSSGKVDILRITVDANNPILARDITNEILKKYVVFFQQLYTSNPREVKFYVQKQMD